MCAKKAIDMEATVQEKERISADFAVLKRKTNEFAARIQDVKLKEMFFKCFYNTLDTTVKYTGDQVYVITGDIDAMWLRDSSAQVMQYLEFAGDCPDTRKLIRGLVRRQMFYILCDPYANAFNSEFNGKGWNGDECDKSPIVHERKFELDSLCYPLALAYRYYKATGDTGVFDPAFKKALNIILDVFTTELRHENSDYYHYRPTEDPSFSVPNRGRGGAIAHTGLVWSGYRPSDDPCVYGYFIPGNMFISVTMGYVEKIAEVAGLSSECRTRAARLKKSVDKGLKRYATVRHREFGKIYAYETDGLGNYNLMDDANVPSLLSLPYLGYCKQEDEIYQNTRRFVLSKQNPYYYEGKVLQGVGSPHTPEGYVWPISLIIEALTTDDGDRINRIVEILKSSDAGTGYVHEGIDCNDAETYTRSWFAWANSLFSYMVLKKAGAISGIN